MKAWFDEDFKVYNLQNDYLKAFENKNSVTQHFLHVLSNC